MTAASFPVLQALEACLPSSEGSGQVEITQFSRNTNESLDTRCVTGCEQGLAADKASRRHLEEVSTWLPDSPSPPCPLPSGAGLVGLAGGGQWGLGTLSPQDLFLENLVRKCAERCCVVWGLVECCLAPPSPGQLQEGQRQLCSSL